MSSASSASSAEPHVVGDPNAAPTAAGRPTRARAGNNMTRARAGILAGAARCLVRFGSRKTTMADIAREGGVAKATLYNHFRTKDDLWAAYAAAEVDALLAEIGDLPAPAGTLDSVRDAIALAASRLSAHPVVRALAAREPELAALIAVPGESAPWRDAHRLLLRRVTLAQAAGTLHPAHDPAYATDELLRWVVSHAFWPRPDDVTAAAHAAVRGLAAPPYAGARPATERPAIIA